MPSPSSTIRDNSPINQKLRALAASAPARPPLPAPQPAGDTVMQVETPRNLPWPATRVLTEDQPTDRYHVPAGPPAERDTSLLADIVAAIPHPVVALNAGGQVQFWSAAAAEAFGYAADEVVGRPPAFVPADRFNEHARLFVQAAAGVRVRDVATTRRHRDGRTVPVLLSMTPHAGGGVVCVLQPQAEAIPQAVAVEEPPKRSEHSRKLETLGRMAAGVVHDLNNLLAVVGGNAELLAEWLPQNTFGSDYAAVIRTAVRHASSLTHRVLNYAKPTETVPLALDLSRVVADLAPLVTAVAGPRIECLFNLGDELPLVVADRGHVEQVILNLVTNARDAMPTGGAVGLRTAAVTVRPGRVGWPADRVPGRYVCLTVADNGAGIDDPTRARMFDPFVTTKKAGTGLGLATVAEVAAAYRGHVEVDSEPEVGTVFRVYFPAPDPADDDTDPVIELPDLHTGESALLVDDNDAVRTLAKAALEGVGYSVIEARTGDEAARLAKVLREPIALLVTDVVLPGLNGRRLAQQVRAARPDVPVVYVSGYAQPDGPPEPRTRFVAKPFTSSQLLAAVQKVAPTSARA